MSIAIDRVIRKLDEHLNRNDLAAAERLLSYWRAEAEISGDDRARLTLLNEQIGLYRKLGKEKECLAAVEAVLSFPEVWAAAQGRDATQSENKEKNSKADFSISDATTLVNAATGLKAFGRAKEALPLYEAAKRIYEQAFLPRNAAVTGRAEQSADPLLSGVDEKLSFLLCGDNADPRTAAAKKETIEEISTVLSELLREKGILTASGSELEPNAYAVNERIKDAGLRGRNIFAGT